MKIMCNSIESRIANNCSEHVILDNTEVGNDDRHSSSCFSFDNHNKNNNDDKYDDIAVAIKRSIVNLRQEDEKEQGKEEIFPGTTVQTLKN